MSIPYDWIIDTWNETARRWGLASVKYLSPSRQAMVRKRWGEWRKYDPDGPQAFFEDVLEAIAERPFYRGKSDHGWKVDFNHLFKNDHNALKLFEGKETEKKPVLLSNADRDMLANTRRAKGEKAYQWLLAKFRKEQQR